LEKHLAVCKSVYLGSRLATDKVKTLMMMEPPRREHFADFDVAVKSKVNPFWD
jgi:hypothetical protein